MFAEASEAPSVVNVAAKSYRAVRTTPRLFSFCQSILTQPKLSLTNPGTYKAILSYYDGRQTVANWFVRETPKEAVAKNVLFFIGDGASNAFAC